MNDSKRAERFAAGVVDEYGVPGTVQRTKDLLAYAYACGAKDGFTESMQLATDTFDEMLASLEKGQS